MKNLEFTVKTDVGGVDDMEAKDIKWSYMIAAGAVGFAILVGVWWLVVGSVSVAVLHAVAFYIVAKAWLIKTAGKRLNAFAAGFWWACYVGAMLLAVGVIS